MCLLGSLRICIAAVDVGIPAHRGGAVHVHHTSRILAENGHEVHVICRRSSIDRSKHEMTCGYYVHRIFRFIIAPVPFSSYGDERGTRDIVRRLGSFFSLLYRLYLRSIYLLYAGLFIAKIVKQYDLDMILERETSFGCGALASIFTGKPLVLEINGPFYSRISLVRAAKIMAYPLIQTELLTKGISENRIEPLFAAVDIDVFKPDPVSRRKTREKYGLKGLPVVVYVGIFAPWHGIMELFEAFRIVLQEIPKARLLLVGPYYQDWMKKVEEWEISDSCIFVGPVEHESVPDYINAGDVSVAPFNPQRWKITKGRVFPFVPFKILEYMACAKAVVSTTVGSIPKIIKNGETGVLVSPSNSTVLAEGILMLLRNPSRREEMGRRARNSIINQYSWEDYYLHLIRIFRDAVA